MTNEEILKNAPDGATHYDTGEGCYLKAVGDALYYMFPNIHKSWHKSHHKDGVSSLEMYDYHVALSSLT